MHTINRDELASLQSLAGDTEAFADALGKLGLPVEPLADGVTKRAREIAARCWERQDCASFAAPILDGLDDGDSAVQSARAAIEADLAIVERVRSVTDGREGAGDFGRGYRAACDAITAAMKGEA